MEDNGVWAVATINLPGLPLGTEVRVNPEDSYVANCLERGYLQRLATRGDADEGEPETEAATPASEDLSEGGAVDAVTDD